MASARANAYAPKWIAAHFSKTVRAALCKSSADESQDGAEGEVYKNGVTASVPDRCRVELGDVADTDAEATQ